MIELANRVSIRARFVFPIISAPIKDAVIHIYEGVVQSLEPYRDQPDVVDLGEVAILPALVNPHTHLEFSALSRPLGEEKQSHFTEWIGDVLEYRSKRDRDPAGIKHAIQSGIQQSLDNGVGTLGEIVTADDCQAYAFEAAGSTNDRNRITCSGVQFLELIGTSEERISDQINRARQHLLSESNSPQSWRAGLSPHAPYTASLRLVSECVQLATENPNRATIPIAMHLAETKEEIEFLASNGGPFRELLNNRGVWNPAAWSKNMAPIDYLRLLAGAGRSLVIHGNYLDNEELTFLAEHNDTMTVVYCPRTHKYFGHDRYPLPEMLKRGIAVAVGTDSRASTPDLCLWSELRHVADNYPEVDPAEILRMGTKNAAAAMGHNDAGFIAPGSLARLITVPIDSADADPHTLLFTNPDANVSWLG